MADAQRGFEPLTHALFVHGSAAAKSHVRTTSITYVHAIANFNCARVDSNHPTRALNRGTKMTTVRSARKSSATYIFDFIDFLVRKEDSNP
jgi:hypothetical protein